MEAFFGYLGTAGAVIFVFAALGFCILFHELGHFLAAKMLGLHVDAFSLGFRPFWRKKYKGVEYRIGYLPFGGYVEIPQIDASDEIPKAADGTELPPGSAKQRIITAAAGPLFNILSGLLIGCIIWIWGMPQDTPKMREITVCELKEDSPEYRAGLRNGDIITKLNGESFNLSWAKFVEQILYTTGKVNLEIRRNGEIRTVSYTPIDNPDAPGLGREGVGYPFFKAKVPIQIFPEPGSIAEKAGLRAGDIVRSANGKSLFDYLQFQNLIDMNCNKELKLTVEREGKLLEFTVTPRPVEELKKHARYLVGVTMAIPEGSDKVMVINMLKGFPAPMAGMMLGDTLLSINGKPVATPEVFSKTVAESNGAPVKVIVKRGEKELEFNLQPLYVTPAGIGISMAVYDYPSPFRQFSDVLMMTWKALRGIATGLGNKLGLTENTSTLKPSHMSGPIGIGMVLFTSIKSSPAIGIYMMVVISFALAIFNLLPFPVLDGGHIFFGLIEIICRRPVPQKIVKVLSYIFVTLLVTLMVFVTFFDIRRAVNRVIPQKPAAPALPAAETANPSEGVANAPENP